MPLKLLDHLWISIWKLNVSRDGDVKSCLELWLLINLQSHGSVAQTGPVSAALCVVLTQVFRLNVYYIRYQNGRKDWTVLGYQNHFPKKKEKLQLRLYICFVLCQFSEPAVPSYDTNTVQIMILYQFLLMLPLETQILC